MAGVTQVLHQRKWPGKEPGPKKRREGQYQLWLPLMMFIPVVMWLVCVAFVYYSFYSTFAACITAVVALGYAYTQLPPSQITNPPSITIVGFGFSGLEMAIQLKRRGVPFRIYEKAPAMGGVWWWNQYPGVACDSLSHSYAFSYEMNADWSRCFPPGAEIRAYMERIATKYGVLDEVRFGHELVGAQWSDEQKQWGLKIKNPAGEVVSESTEVLVSCIGVFHKPKPISFDLSRFRGEVYNTTNWDHGFDPVGKTVAVIGTGASSIQLVPHVAAKAKHLTVFQRSPPWIIPKTDYDYPEWLQWMFRNVPLLLRMHRYAVFLQVECFMHFVMNDESKEKTIPLAFKRFMTRVNRWLVNGLPEEWQKNLVPDYLPGCKRVIISGNYLQSFYKKNVTLVPKAVKTIEERSVVTVDGEKHDVDIIACATGFDLLNHPTAEVIVGRGGARLVDFFNTEPLLYQGAVAPGFPNLFVMFGPGSLNGFSGVMQIERQSVYVVKVIKEMARRRLATVEVSKTASEEYFTKAQARLQMTPLGSTCTSYYRNAKGVVWSHVPGGSFENMWINWRVKWGDYILTPKAK